MSVTNLFLPSARAFLLALSLLPALAAQSVQSASSLAGDLRQLTLDSTQTYKIRELELVRGDVKIYLTEGTLSFLKPIAGRTVAAIFDTSKVEGGDGEVLLLPGRRSERASFARYTKSPNLNEHFGSALFFFTDATQKDLMRQIEERPVKKTPEAETEELAKTWNAVVRNVSGEVDLRLIASLLSDEPTSSGFFFSLVNGRRLGLFDINYVPDDFEPLSLGQVVRPTTGSARYQLWTSFRPKRAAPFVQERRPCDDYKVDLTVKPDLTVAANTKFKYYAARTNRVLSLDLSPLLNVTSATIDGQAAEVYQHATDLHGEERSSSFLLVNPEPLIAGRSYEVAAHYGGSMIRKTGDGSYLVLERNSWFPHRGATLSTFDMTVRCPANLQIVSTGALVGESTENGMRIVHRRTAAPERFAGFNLGEYSPPLREHGEYEVECYANRAFAQTLQSNGKNGNLLLFPSSPFFDMPHKILAETERLLGDYSKSWGMLPRRDLIVSPVPGYFGQGFPGLIYLSNVTYMREEDRPADVRDAMSNLFFTEMLLPHETAHQWWGNLITSANYRSDWLMEAMANEAAIEELSRNAGHGAVEQVLGSYRKELLKDLGGETVESAGPVDFGVRLEEGSDLRTWQTIVYKKGTWILWMLRERLGPGAFAQLQKRLIAEYSTKPITNEDLRQVASELQPPGPKDRTLETFFDAWVYSTGIPKIVMAKSGREVKLTMTSVDEDFVVDVPLRCTMKSGKEEAQWVRLSTGTTEWEMPKDVVHCRLPASSEFLYTE